MTAGATFAWHVEDASLGALMYSASFVQDSADCSGHIQHKRCVVSPATVDHLLRSDSKDRAQNVDQSVSSSLYHHAQAITQQDCVIISLYFHRAYFHSFFLCMLNRFPVTWW